MSDVGHDNGRESDGVPEGGILAALPRTRPQRASPRRVSAQSADKQASATSKQASATAKPAGTGPRKAKPAARTATKTRAAAGSTPSAASKRKGKTVKQPTSRAKAPQARAVPVRPVRKKTAPRREPPAPKQGYEPEDEVELGTTVNPPSSVELVESVADIVSELAGAGLTAGGRLLKDTLSLLRRP